MLNSTVWHEPSNVGDELERQVEFLRADLRTARDNDSRHIIVFVHHPPFLTYVDEGDSWLVIPRRRRRVLLDLLTAHGAKTVFAGHWHRNHIAYYGDLQVVCSGPVGLPMGDDPSGLRVVKVFDDRIEHRYFGFDEVPESVDLEAWK